MTRPGALVLAVLALSGCGGLDPVQPCGEIPEDGCPIGRGGTCDDALCAALYDCVEGRWERVETCDNDPVGVGAGGAGVGGQGGAGGCATELFDRSREAPSCTPDLQPPDCPAAAAESCNPCLTGCEDFFLCQTDGWVTVAFCDEEGVLVVTQGSP